MRLTLALLAALACNRADAQEKTVLVETKAVGNCSGPTDLVRLKDRWVVVCTEGGDLPTLRVLTSADGARWESAVRMTSSTPERGLYDPRLTVTPNGVAVTALGTVPPVPKYGGTVRTVAWASKDGRAWGEQEPFGPENYPLGGVVWHKGTRYAPTHGVICGSMQTVKVVGGPADEPVADVYEKTFSGFFPGDSSLAFVGDTAHWVMTRYSAVIGNARMTGYYGTAKAPFKAWEWKELDAKIGAPNLLSLADGRVVAAVGLFDGKARTALCEFDAATGKLTEVLDVPVTGGGRVGLAEHDGHVWMSYHAGGKVHLAKVKMGRAVK